MGAGRDAGGDADRQRQHHQRREHRVAPQAAEAEREVRIDRVEALVHPGQRLKIGSRFVLQGGMVAGVLLLLGIVPIAACMLTVLLTAAASILLTVLTMNFGSGEKEIDRRITHLYPADHPQFEYIMGNLLGPPVVAGNQVQALLNGDQIFPSMLTAIAGARTTINFETYIYWGGKIGRKFAEALAERGRRVGRAEVDTVLCRHAAHERGDVPGAVRRAILGRHLRRPVRQRDLDVAGGSDVLSTTFGFSVNVMFWTFRALLFVVPASAADKTAQELAEQVKPSLCVVTTRGRDAGDVEMAAKRGGPFGDQVDKGQQFTGQLII